MLERVTVIIPTRNEAERIGQFLASLPPALQLIVVDASDDATPEVVQHIRPHATRVIRSPTRIATARQIGAAAAQTEWLLFSDADVRFEAGYFDRIGAYLHHDAFYGPKYATASHPFYTRCFISGQQWCDRLGFPAASGSNMAIQRHVFDALGGFRLDLPVNEDSELFLRLAHRGFSSHYAADLGVHSIDDRRLDRGSLRKMLHSALRGALIAAGFRVPLPQRLLRHDWGYWRPARRRSLFD
jgi:glycosyltransferase involved in cell wall biosynthesis